MGKWPDGLQIAAKGRAIWSVTCSINNLQEGVRVSSMRHFIFQGVAKFIASLVIPKHLQRECPYLNLRCHSRLPSVSTLALAAGLLFNLFALATMAQNRGGSGFAATEFLEPIAPVEYPRRQMPAQLIANRVTLTTEQVQDILVSKGGEWDMRTACIKANSAQSVSLTPTTLQGWKRSTKNPVSEARDALNGLIEFYEAPSFVYREDGTGQSIKKGYIRHLRLYRQGRAPEPPRVLNANFNFTVLEHQGKIILRVFGWTDSAIEPVRVIETGEFGFLGNANYDKYYPEVCEPGYELRTLRVHSGAQPMS